MIMAQTKLDKTQATAFMKEFFEQFKGILNRQTPMNIKDFEKIISSDFKITANGHSVAKSLQEYLKRAESLQKKYSHFEITDIVAEPLTTDNKMVVSYNLQLTGRNGQKTEVHIMAIATVENHKITNWTEVTNEEGSTRWDKA